MNGVWVVSLISCVLPSTTPCHPLGLVPSAHDLGHIVGSTPANCTRRQNTFCICICICINYIAPSYDYYRSPCIIRFGLYTLFVLLLICVYSVVTDVLHRADLYAGCADGDYEFMGAGCSHFRLLSNICMLVNIFYHHWGCDVVYSAVVGTAPCLRPLPCVGGLAWAGRSVGSTHCDSLLTCISCWEFCGLFQGVLVFRDV